MKQAGIALETLTNTLSPCDISLKTFNDIYLVNFLDFNHRLKEPSGQYSRTNKQGFSVLPSIRQKFGNEESMIIIPTS
jgi:hypothetical protein